MVKSTGIVRKVDELGRIVIPIELRRNLDIEEKDSLEIYVEDDHIILKKYSPACSFCETRTGSRFSRAETFAKAALTSFALSEKPKKIKRFNLHKIV